jgi:hypothetical protein
MHYEQFGQAATARPFAQEHAQFIKRKKEVAHLGETLKAE